MNSKINLGVIAIILVILAVSVSAVTINGESNISLCQCSTDTQVFSVCAETTGNYTVSVSGIGAKWVKFAPSTLNISAGSCKDLFLFVTPECYATSGSFPFELNVSGPEESTKNISLFVEQCHSFNYSVNPVLNNSKPCEQNIYNISVTNTGKFTDEYVLLQKGLDDSWVNYPRDSFVLSPGESLNTNLKLESFCSTPSGSYPFTLKLSNTRTNNSSIKDLVQQINDFVPITNNIASKIVLCAEEGREINVELTNVSNKKDEFTISLDNELVSVNTQKIELESNETKTIVLTIKSSLPQSTNFNFLVNSKNYNKTYTKNVELSLEDCYNISIDRLDLQNNYCFGNNSLKYLLTNNGTHDANILVSITGLNAESKNIFVNSGEEKEVILNFSQQEGTKNIVVNAETNYSKDTIEYSINFENCYGAELIVPSVSICATENKLIDVVLKNTGTQQQTFNVTTTAPWITISNPQVIVDSNSQKIISLQLNGPSEIGSIYSISAISNNSEIVRTIPITLFSQEECYAFSVQKTNEIIDVNCCDGVITELLIKNNGNFSQTITLEKIAPEWVSFSHKEIILGSGEEKIVYVYFSPPIGTNGQLIGSILVSNQKGISQIFDFNLNVFGGNCGVGLNANLGVDGEVTLTKIFTRKEIDVEFNIINDSNVGFNIVDIKVQEYPDADVKFDSGVFLSPQESTKARLTVSFLENQEPLDREVTLNILTSVGEFNKNQLIKFSESKDKPVYDEVAITGFFTQFIVPATGVLFLIILLGIILLVAGKSNEKKGSKKK
ncbi:MAG: hypothetical protein PHX27_03270 [Candidatus ainarchaeum sp.]|nr:hypothetical protein [Candidatus ainarchaeum sp.]